MLGVADSTAACDGMIAAARPASNNSSFVFGVICMFMVFYWTVLGSLTKPIFASHASMVAPRVQDVIQKLRSDCRGRPHSQITSYGLPLELVETDRQ